MQDTKQVVETDSDSYHLLSSSSVDKLIGIMKLLLMDQMRIVYMIAMPKVFSWSLTLSSYCNESKQANTVDEPYR